jgi:hypothetical protein
MKLSEADSRLFYKLFFPLLDFANQKFKVNELKKLTGAKSLNPAKVKEIANAVWENPSCIDEYVEKNETSLNDEEKQILLSWKKSISGRFVLERHLKKGSVFIGEHNDVYLVKGIISSFEEMFWFQKPPIAMDITILPFKDCMITDGLNLPLNITFGGGIKSILKNAYMDAKKEERIITQL